MRSKKNQSKKKRSVDLISKQASLIKKDSDKNFGLAKESFDQMVKELRSNNEELFETIFLNHFEKCTVYIQRKYGAAYEDAYDATMDALLDFRLRMIDGKIRYGNLKYLMTKMASQFYLRNVKKFRIREIEDTDLVISEKMDEEDFQAIQSSWKMLGKDCQTVLGLNFYSGMKLSAIAEHLEKSAAAIRKQKERCLKKLMKLYSTQINLIEDDKV